MANFRSFARAAGRMRCDRSGAAAVIFAITLLPIALAIGAAIDYSANTRMRAMLTSSLDSAALSVAVGQVSGQNITQNSATLSRAVKKALEAALGTSVATSTIHVSAYVDNDGALASTASVAIPTNFMRLVGVNQMTVTAQSTVTLPAGPVELAMVLDTTGSMAGAKIAALKTAATDLTNTLFSVPNASSNVKVGVVPFSDYVNIGLADRNASWLTGAQDYTVPATGSCTTQPNMVCTGGYQTVTGTCTNDGASYSCSWQNCLGYTQQGTYQSCPSATTHTWRGCVGSRAFPADVQGQADRANAGNPVPAQLDRNCATPLQRLTSNQALVQTAINNLTANGETYIAPGLLWGWRVLSPFTPYADGAAYNSRTRKYIVLMTDGFNTHSPNYPNHEGTDTTTANSLTAQTCASIKAQKITIFTVAFQVTDPTIKNILQACATSASGYYDSASAADLQAAFQSIGNAITQVRILQ